MATWRRKARSLYEDVIKGSPETSDTAPWVGLAWRTQKWQEATSADEAAAATFQQNWSRVGCGHYPRFQASTGGSENVFPVDKGTATLRPHSGLAHTGLNGLKCFSQINGLDVAFLCHLVQFCFSHNLFWKTTAKKCGTSLSNLLTHLETVSVIGLHISV